MLCPILEKGLNSFQSLFQIGACFNVLIIKVKHTARQHPAVFGSMIEAFGRDGRGYDVFRGKLPDTSFSTVRFPFPARAIPGPKYSHAVMSRLHPKTY